MIMEGQEYDQASFLIGLSLAILSSIFIGSSFIIKKMALKKMNALGNTRPSAGGYSYLKQWMWWLGFLTMGIGEAANLVAYAFAPAALVTPLGALSVLVAAVLSAKFLNEKLNFVGKIGCFLCIIGSIIFVIHSPKHEEINQFSELITKLGDHIFLSYVLTILTMSLIIKIVFVSRFGNTSIIVYLLICSAIGSLTVVFCKGVALGLKDSIKNDTNPPYSSSYVFWVLLILSIICIIIQMNYLNKALDIFNTNIVTPVYYVMFTVLVIMASGILFREWEHMKTYDILGCFCGFFILMVAVFTLNTFKDISLTFKDLNLNSRHRVS
ncbi:magnesium transporter NIPA2 isoform X1 [Maniola jurtina]|uniref:magnesium transporter NIPA2 isoform X1 n=2 Tax=Maniola jurtina TaxID=191418 RepID=UPI001E686CE1|nr:magnesium transporter NIPA2 isoform X1 [Maniola jurtina]XP_045768507.1 magnesium transporter NIPA2 isoform X1 [Maniola jurtina]